MNYVSALKILGLKNGFNEKELKKAHRKLANLYHPDRNQNPSATEKMKEINEAREILANYLKTRQRKNNEYNSYQTRDYDNKADENLNNYRIYLINKIKEKTTFNYKKYHISKNIELIIKQIEEYQEDFIRVLPFKNKEIIDKIYNKYINEIKKDFIQLELVFYKEIYLEKEDIKEKINYDCNINEFYNQLLKIKEKYNKKEIVKKVLESEISKYKYFVGYDKLTKLIEICLKDTLIEIMQKGYQYNKKDIEKMHQTIEKHFEQYFKISKKITDLELKINLTNSQRIKNNYKLIKEQFEKSTNFIDIEKNITILENLISKYQHDQEIKINFENNKDLINHIYQTLLENYQTAINNSNEVNNVDEIEKINSKFNDVLKLFKKGCSEYQDLNFFNLFNYIDFNPSINNQQIIKELNNKIKNKNEKIYVVRKEKLGSMALGDNNCFFMLEEEKKLFYRIDSFGISQIKYKENEQEEFLKNYIQLEQLLDECIYVGEYKINIFGETIPILYESDDYYIYLDKKDTICVKVNSSINLKSTGKKINYPIFEDKEKMINIIINQNNKRLKENKNGFIHDATNNYNSRKSR